MSSQIAAELLGANPGPAVHLAVLGGIVVIGLVIFALSRWHKRREGQVDDDLATRDLSGAIEPRSEATHLHESRTDPARGASEDVHDEQKRGSA